MAKSQETKATDRDRNAKKPMSKADKKAKAQKKQEKRAAKG